ncbi:MAG: hypothetical protein ACFFDF_18770, partial [Candidatus Odinarchaeota archaeon]
MDERKEEEEFEEDFDEEELDLTKDAFFSDLMDMEEEIANEAYQLVEHAMNLIKTQYYDDAIEILRQAVGLYTQINRTEEIKAINDKITEVYMRKEEVFIETEVKPDITAEAIDEGDVDEKPERVKEVKIIEDSIIETDMIKKADHLIVKAHELANNNNFEEALDTYDQVETILDSLGKSDEIERLYVTLQGGGPIYDEWRDSLVT